MDSLKSYLVQGTSFVKESWTELGKVHFPTPKETLQATLVVVALVVILALWLGLIDLGAKSFVRQIIR
ncbi:MAG TPA: preprotein translocase subunit SecE [Candidatus Binataceae bacterium]|jgi:preprotein translocase subunit SecE